jgi:hypothetical protein
LLILLFAVLASDEVWRMYYDYDFLEPAEPAYPQMSLSEVVGAAYRKDVGRERNNALEHHGVGAPVNG